MALKTVKDKVRHSKTKKHRGGGTLKPTKKLPVSKQLIKKKTNPSKPGYTAKWADNLYEFRKNWKLSKDPRQFRKLPQNDLTREQIDIRKAHVENMQSMEYAPEPPPKSTVLTVLSRKSRNLYVNACKQFTRKLPSDLQNSVIKYI